MLVKVVAFFKDDLSVETLRLQLQTLAANYNGGKHNLSDIFLTIFVVLDQEYSL